jgi:ribosomal protein S18 acetylase RimI-like enzyme
MMTVQSIKVITVSALTIAIIAIAALLLYAGVSPIYVLIAFLAAAAIAYVAYVLSDRLLIAIIGPSTRDVPAGIQSAIKQYCEQEHMPIPLVAVVRQSLPDVYVDGIGKKKTVVVITSAAISNFSESELSEMAIREIGALEKYKVLDMAVTKLILAPLNRIHKLWLHRFYMRSDVTLDGRLDEHVTFRKAREDDLAYIYRIGFDAFKDATGIPPLHHLAYRFRSPTSVIIIAEYDGQPAGFSIGHIKHGSIGAYGHGDLLAVRKQFRQHGIGRGLTEAFIRAQVAHGCGQMCMEVWEQNHGAIKLYIDMGYTRRKTIKDFFKKGQNADIMCKKLMAQPVDPTISVKRHQSSEEVSILCSQDMKNIKTQN